MNLGNKTSGLKPVHMEAILKSLQNLWILQTWPALWLQAMKHLKSVPDSCTAPQFMTSIFKVIYWSLVDRLTIKEVKY